MQKNQRNEMMTLTLALALLGGCAPSASSTRPVGVVGHHVHSFFAGTPLVVGSTSTVATLNPGEGGAPGPYREDGAPSASAGEAKASSPGEHVVEPGETLWRISRRHGVTVDALMAHNGLNDPTQLRAGQTLRIPPAVGADPQPSPSEAPKNDVIDAPPAAPGRLQKPDPAPKKAEPPSPPARSEAKSLARPKEATPEQPLRPVSDSKSKVSSDVKSKLTSDPKGKSSSNPKSKTSTKSDRGTTLQWPVQGKVTSRFGTRWGRSHDGIDITAPEGTEVKAAADGTVLFAAPHGSYGNLVVLKHRDGLVTVYAHNKINLVRKGQRVIRGQLIAKVGNTGRASGPHLHFEVRQGTQPHNPMRYLPP